MLVGVQCKKESHQDALLVDPEVLLGQSGDQPFSSTFLSSPASGLLLRISIQPGTRSIDSVLESL